MRLLRRRYAPVLVVFALLLLALPGTGRLVQAAPNQVAIQQTPAPQDGPETQVDPDCDPAQATCNTFEFGGGWMTDPETTQTGAGGYFAVKHSVLADTSFQYFESPWVQNHVPDNEALLQGFAFAILSQMGQTSPTPVATGTLADGTLWHLYAVPISGTPYGMLFTADTADPSQNDVDTILTSPASTFDQALAAVQTDIRVNGISPLAGIDPTQLMTALGGDVAVTPSVDTTPTPGSTPSAAPTAAVPSVESDQTVTVGTASIAYDGAWTYDAANSSAENATFKNSQDPRVIFGAAQGPDRMSDGNVQVALQILNAPASFGAQNAQQVASETLPSGRAYVLYQWEREGSAEVALFVVDVTTAPGTFDVQLLLAPPDQFLPSLVSVQQSFQINGVAPFSELDQATLASLIGGDVPSTPATGTTSGAGPTPTSGSSRTNRSPRGESTTPAAAVTPTTGVAGQVLTVAGASITYTAQWVYDTVNSEPDGVTYFDAADESGSWFGYVPAQPTTGEAAAQLADFNARYFQNIGATEVQQLTLEALTPTSAWALTTANLAGFPIVVLTYAETATADVLRVQMLYSPQTVDMVAKLSEVQADIQIDGVLAFAGLDPATVAALLGSGTTGPAATTSQQRLVGTRPEGSARLERLDRRWL
jgi:VCBS repeat-containing protein